MNESRITLLAGGVLILISLARIFTAHETMADEVLGHIRLLGFALLVIGMAWKRSHEYGRSNFQSYRILLGIAAVCGSVLIAITLAGIFPVLATVLEVSLALGCIFSVIPLFLMKRRMKQAGH